MGIIQHQEILTIVLLTSCFFYILENETLYSKQCIPYLPFLLSKTARSNSATPDQTAHKGFTLFHMLLYNFIYILPGRLAKILG